MPAHSTADDRKQPLRSDAELIIAAREDPDQFRVLYDRYAERMYGFFRRRTRDHDAALDLTAETFAAAWVSKHGFRDLAAGSAGPWLFTIAKRVLIESVRRRRLETKTLDRLRVQARPPADQDARTDERWLEGLDADLERALAELPTDQRQAVELRVLGELPYVSVANRLGCSATAARIRVSRGLKRLRARMEANQL